jgi:hypothetical protein
MLLPGRKSHSLSPIRARHIAVCVSVGGVRRTVLLVFWNANVGWLYVEFPDAPETDGLLAEITIPAGSISAGAQLATIGHYATHMVKYSHPIDGNAHFSRDGYDSKCVRSSSVRLDQAGGHVFTVLVRGIERFAESKPKYRSPGTQKRAAAEWDLGAVPTGAWL